MIIYENDQCCTLPLKQHRSLKSALPMQIKQALFLVFGENNLDSINTNVAPSKIMEWKASDKTKSCYKKLFTLIFSDSINTYMAKIFAKVWPTTIPLDMKIAYAITIYKVTLSQHYEKFTIRKDIVKDRLIKNLYKLQKGEKFLPQASDIETSNKEVIEEVRESKKKRRKSQPSKMKKLLKIICHFSIDVPPYDDLQHYHDDPQQETSSASASFQKGAGHQESQ
ncbi:hypothetical protein C2G38_2222564 [Gigaspora rosea]|uniref:Uncharacterized protein n=1 Tax=Gigaspora rosea TaxID=44941 RepID=A0A397U2E4_9GLOM|nr:hypothetical protein C2G38_2222564 [Gigaspora rosea]